MNDLEKQNWRVERLKAAIDKVAEGNATEFGRRLGYKDGAFIRQLMTSARPITEKTVAAVEKLPGMRGWFDNSRSRIITPPVIGGITSNVSDPEPIIRRVPVISWVQAGAWSKVTDVRQLHEVDEWLPVPVGAGPRCFALKVVGESMFNPDGEPSFTEGDRIFVDPDRDAQHRSLVVVQLADSSEATFKQLIVESERKYLKALNPAWPNRIFEVNGNATICGIVIGKQVSYI